VQPMKVAAAEALWDTANPASLSLFTIGDEVNQKDVWSLRIPRLLSILSYNSLDGEVKGIRDLQAEYTAKFGPADYSPWVFAIYWSFRAMVGAGMLMLLIALYALYNVMRNRPLPTVKFIGLFPLAIALPFIANSTGWIMTELGRQPWIVFKLLLTSQAFSPSITVGQVLTSLILFTLIYGGLMVADVYLLVKYARTGVVETKPVHKGKGAPKLAEESYWE
jgi:cytochrome bd ubiquinol oxidase subunit I